ncbi:MAG: DUF2806 domain-containing protein [Olsenella sp.]|nr:DUF2806 domain-containing protein [Olsenella sp.]MCI1645875.1 DUF2806 domain-containing protein [Olsenella sp.]MCI1810747.1 DUF2806 domain-containing protein [Olsenella sp.]
MGSFSPKASAEANGIKIANTFNIDGDIAKEWLSNKLGPKEALPMNFIARTRRSLNATKYETDIAGARRVRTQSICDSFLHYKQTMPSLSDNQAFLLASGYMLTPSEAENVTKVLSDAAESAAPDVDPDVLDDQFKDEFIKGSACAYDEEVKALWVKLLSSELTKPGSFPKRALAVLQDMSREDADALQALCSCSVFMDRRNPTPVLTELDEGGWTYNHGSISADQLNLMTSLGLVDTSMHINYGVPAKSGLNVFTENLAFLLTNDSDEMKQVNFGSAIYTPVGRQLAQLCSLGIAPKLPDLVAEVGKKFEMSCELMPFHFS